MQQQCYRLAFILAIICAGIVAAQQFPSDEQNSDTLTTNYGAGVSNNRDSLTVGERGPTLLEDYWLLEKLANFDRERIPERVVHAVGAAAKGVFRVTGDVSAWTMAKVFQPNTETPVLVRFSTVIHPAGSPETLRDPRGFAVKFYTTDGNYDLVGNNLPVFFIRDGLKFPDMVHALKPNPRNNQQEWWRIWDFFSYHPECMHMFTWLLDDVGIPRDYRHMDGFGVHTYTWINRESQNVLVKYHWVSEQGVESLINDEQVRAIKNHKHATQDLYDSIAAGQFPKWKLFVQKMDPSIADRLPFDPLDPTKTWPESDFPMHEVGEMTLNQNVDNFFNENEQAAFSPSMIVPGIYYSDDKLLQARLFSYPDTQRYRLGGNYLMLPVNAPRNSHFNNMHNGRMNFMKRTSAVNYHPSRIQPVAEAANSPTRFGAFNTTAQRVTIDREENFMQATERYNKFDTDRKYRFQMRLVEAYSDNRISDSIRTKWVNYWRAVHTDLGEVVRTLRPTITPTTPVNQPATTAPTQTPQMAEEKSDQSVAVAVLTVFLVLVSVALVISVAINIVHRNIISKSQHANRERLLYDTTKNEL
eukprot:TRINITY_DN369_c0_g1_i1.p1 TRINITY_DN369_c0_g1~~TRINITY_DN369_c0_g1_i1.p1  ORF type:complete len:585 (+),score=186.13 TRINITY_DN369_c0_g1_i1:133-1887(+)